MIVELYGREKGIQDHTTVGKIVITMKGGGVLTILETDDGDVQILRDDTLGVKDANGKEIDA